jgi:hypothetical protein
MTSETNNGPEVVEQLTVNLVENASDALGNAARRSRLSRTDVVNRALQLYDLLGEVEASGGATFVYRTRWRRWSWLLRRPSRLLILKDIR